MPRPRVDRRYSDAVPTLVEEGYRPRDIWRALQALAKRANRTDPPSERTVYNLIKAHRAKDVGEQRRAALYHWPRVHEQGLLPWTASAAGMELLRFRDEFGRGRPTIRQVEWYWRVKQAQPGAPPISAHILSAMLAAREVVQSDGSSRPDAAPIEAELMYAPWRSEADQAAYTKATTRDSHPLPRSDEFAVEASGVRLWEIRADHFGADVADWMAAADAARASGQRLLPPWVLTPDNVAAYAFADEQGEEEDADGQASK